MQLFETNKQLRALSPEELDQPETRRRIENQAAAERANGRRLSGLVVTGEDLVKQAMRNPEFGVGHLEKWAEMLQILKDISANRMPSVADLLKQAAQAPKLAANPPANQHADGRARSAGRPAPAPPAEAGRRSRARPAVPQVVDRESSQNPPQDKERQAGQARRARSRRRRCALPHDDPRGQAERQRRRPTPPPQADGRGGRASSRTCSPSSRRSPTS